MARDNPDVVCPRCRCGHTTRLFGIEWETEDHDLYTFVCKVCGEAKVLSVPVQPDNDNQSG